MISRLVHIICLVSHASGFSSRIVHLPLTFDPTARQTTMKPPQRTPAARVLKAMIFYPEDDDGPSFDDNDYSVDLQKQNDDLADKLTSNQSILTHLASAYAPAGHAIDMKQINSVRCASLDNRHLEIEAVLCDDLECNSVLVPVEFPNECVINDSPVFEECVMNNVHSLDHDGKRRLPHKELFANPDAESVYETMKSATELLRNAPLVFPEWWVPPTTNDFSECELLKELLNGEDMSDARMDLILQSQKSWLEETVEFTHVLAIGPMGIILKVKTIQTDSDMKDATGEEVVPIRFENGGSIREKVLQAVSCMN